MKDVQGETTSSKTFQTERGSQELLAFREVITLLCCPWPCFLFPGGDYLGMQKEIYQRGSGHATTAAGLYGEQSRVKQFWEVVVLRNFKQSFWVQEFRMSKMAFEDLCSLIKPFIGSSSCTFFFFANSPSIAIYRCSLYRITSKSTSSNHKNVFVIFFYIFLFGISIQLFLF